jgi:hypothetical protein
MSEGIAQVAWYLAAARENCDSSAPWHLGIAYPTRTWQLTGDRTLFARQMPGVPGLILYRITQRRRQPQEQPDTAPVTEKKREINWQNVLNVVVALGLSIALVVVILAALLDPDPFSKLALAGLSVAMIGIILSTFGIDDNRTGGPSA